jgi:hypothetical protein
MLVINKQGASAIQKRGPFHDIVPFKVMVWPPLTPKTAHISVVIFSITVTKHGNGASDQHPSTEITLSCLDTQ